MAKKKKSEVTRLEEGDQTLYSTFCGAANVLSLIYTQAIAQQKLAFQSGERHAMVSLLLMFVCISIARSSASLIELELLGFIIRVILDDRKFRPFYLGFQVDCEFYVSNPCARGFDVLDFFWTCYSCIVRALLISTQSDSLN